MVIILSHYFLVYPSTLIDNVSSTSLSQGFISRLFNSALQYPSNDFSIISFSFNILFVSFFNIFYFIFFSLLVIHPYTIISTRLVFFFDELYL